MRILYIAPFFERNALGEAATAYVKALSKNHEITCRPIGNKEQENPVISALLNNKGADYLVIHSKPEDFCWKSGFKKIIGITHLKNPLIEDTNYQNYFNLVDFAYHDSSFEVKGLRQIKPYFNKEDYTEIGPKKEKTPYKFLIVGNPTCYEDMFLAIRAYSDEFRCEEQVDLTIKPPTNLSVQKFAEILSSLQNDIRKYNSPMYPTINFNNHWMKRKELLEFYNGIDCIINCSVYNEWSRPFIDCLALKKRCISLIGETKVTEKRAFGPSEYKDYPVGVSNSFATNEIKRVMRAAFDGHSENKLKISDFQEDALTQLEAIFQ